MIKINDSPAGFAKGFGLLSFLVAPTMKSCIALLIALTILPIARAEKTPAAENEFFEQKIRPLLVEKCYPCHSIASSKSKGGLRMDSREAILKGGDSGPALIPGNPEQSLLYKAILYQDPNSAQMPPKGKLPAKDITLLAEWIRRGASFPGSNQKVENKGGVDIAKGRKFWSFQPVAKTNPPAVVQKDWPINRIDIFLLAQQEKHELKPSSQASPEQFLRRAYFDLIGLPPSPADFAAFQNPSSSDYEHLVDKLLASRQYGEKWARFWLDLVRYADIMEQWAETKGQPYLYRDWVIRALNEDMPFDRFAKLQLAADQMNAPIQDRPALGFLGLSPSYWKELQLPPTIIKTIVADEFEEKIHTLTSTFLGLNAACARCHDHKNDPITVQDYYGLAGVFASTRPTDLSLFEEQETKAILHGRQTIATLETDLKKLQAQKPVQDPAKVSATQKQIEEIRKNTPHLDAAFAVGVQDASLHVVADGEHKTKLDYKINQAQDIPIHIRGNPNNPGAIAPRKFLSVLSNPDSTPFARGSGRLELSNSIFTDAKSLTARVIVNRVWKQHFDRGIVDTPSDFGLMGEKPSHPELLDDLAGRFIDNGWSLKWLHREIMLSAAYRQKSGPAAGLDPENRMLARMPRKRLSVESWRDSMLSVAGNLDSSIGGPAQDLGSPTNFRRTIYGTVKRRELNDLLRLHDFPDPITHSPNRIPTTTPLQQLYTLNSPFVQAQAEALVKRLKSEFPGNDSEQIIGAYNLLFGRKPTEGQLKTALDFIQTPGNSWQLYSQALLASNEFLFID